MTVSVKLLVELSLNLLDWQVRREVFVMAVSGGALGVKAEV